jgi:hypothetical protein
MRISSSFLRKYFSGWFFIPECFVSRYRFGLFVVIVSAANWDTKHTEVFTLLIIIFVNPIFRSRKPRLTDVGIFFLLWKKNIINTKKGLGNAYPLRWPRDTLYPQKLALTSPTSGGRWVDIVRLWTKSHGVCLLFETEIQIWFFVLTRFRFRYKTPNTICCRLVVWFSFHNKKKLRGL